MDFGLFLLFDYLKNAAMNNREQVFVWGHAFIYLGYISKRNIHFNGRNGE